MYTELLQCVHDRVGYADAGICQRPVKVEQIILEFHYLDLPVLSIGCISFGSLETAVPPRCGLYNSTLLTAVYILSKNALLIFHYLYAFEPSLVAFLSLRPGFDPLFAPMKTPHEGVFSLEQVNRIAFVDLSVFNGLRFRCFEKPTKSAEKLQVNRYARFAIPRSSFAYSCPFSISSICLIMKSLS